MPSTAVAFNVSAASTVKQDWTYRHFISQKTYYTLMSILSFQGVKIEPERLAHKCLEDYFDYLLENDESVFDSIESIVSNRLLLSNDFLDNVFEIVKFPAGQFSHLKIVFNSLSDYFNIERFAKAVEDSNTFYIDVSFSDKSDVFDLSVDELFSVDYSNIDTTAHHIYKTKLNKCYLTLYTAMPIWKRQRLEAYVNDSTLTDSYKSSNSGNAGNYFCVEPLANSDFQLSLFLVVNIPVSRDVYYNSSFDFSSRGFRHWSLSLHNKSRTQSFVVMSTTLFVDYENAKSYEIRGCSDKKFRFVRYIVTRFSADYDESDCYLDLSFDSEQEAYMYALNAYGLTADFEVPDTSTSDDSGSVDVDNDRQQQMITYIENYDIDNNEFIFVYPTTENSFQILNDDSDSFIQPERITVDANNNYYLTDFDDIPVLSTTSLLSQKFPFCLASDFYHLFSNFSSESVSAPTVDMLVLPANFLEFENDEIVFTIDFTEYNTIVQILRFFIALSFSVSLILITKKFLF